MRTVAFPDSVDVTPGSSGVISVAITNTTSVIDAYRVQVFGLDPEWVTVNPPRVSLFPGQTENVEIEVRLPDDYPASERTVSVNVSSDDDPGAFSLNQVAIAVLPRTRTTVRLDPAMITGGRSARFGMIVSNDGNAAVTAAGYAVDPEALAEFRFTPPHVVVPPGRDQVIEVTASGGRNWFGQPRARTFTFGVETDIPAGQRIETIGTFVQRPRISRWLISLLGLLTAAAVFAAVLSRTFDQVVEQARVSDAVLDAALERDVAGGAVVPADPGTVTGRLVSASTGAGLSGAQADLYTADELTAPFQTAATDADGSFTFTNLGRGNYRLRLSGAGVDTIWYAGPEATSSSAGDAADIEVRLGDTTPLGEVKIAGTPVDVTGTIALPPGVDPAGTKVSIVVPGASGEGAVVGSTQLGPDGSFTLPGVPSPGDYQLIVEKPGSPPEVRDLALEPGRPLPELEVAVAAGSGLISGVVNGPNGPLGGATISASDGTTEIRTVSLTQGAVGTYELRNLPTPAQYTITISRPGYASEARTVALTNEQTAGTFDAYLVPSTGSISGHVSIDGAVGRGVTVNVTGGDTNRTTGVISQGAAAGTYSFGGLDAPGTYTLTFSGAGTIPQVRVVDLDPAGGVRDVTGVDVVLSPVDTTVSGVVRGPSGNPLGQATVTLTDGAVTRTILTADDPVGRFAFSGVRPGAYTLTASRPGTVPVTLLVNVTSGAAPGPLDVQLGEQASIHGRVVGSDPANPVVVRLFLPEQFPHGQALATATVDADGGYSFTGLEAPANYLVAVYASSNAADPLDSQVVASIPGAPATAAPFDLGAAP